MSATLWQIIYATSGITELHELAAAAPYALSKEEAWDEVKYEFPGEEAVVRYLAGTSKAITTPDRPACPICGMKRCYNICPNSRHYYSPEREREDSLFNDSLSQSEWFSAAVRQYEAEH